MYCRYCGQQIDPSPFCPHCGKPTAVSVKSNAESAISSKPTGSSDSVGSEPTVSQSVVSESASTESVASNSSSSETVTPSLSTRKHPSSKLIALIVAIAVVILGGAGFAFAYFVVPQMNTANQPSQEQQAISEEQPVVIEDETKSETQPEPQPEPEPEPITYSYSYESVDVSIMGDPVYSEGERSTATWTYPQLESSRSSEAVDYVNKTIKDTFLNDASLMESQDADNYTRINDGITIMSRQATVTYLQDGVVCIYIEEYATEHGMHGGTQSDTIIYDLDANTPLTAAQVCNMDEYDFADEARAAVRDYINAEGSDIYTAEEAVEGCVPGSTYYLTNEGAVLTTPDYGLGSYAYGRRTIVIVPFDSDYHRGEALDN